MPDPCDEPFSYDADGNLIEDENFAHTWNGENRLVKVEPRIATAGSMRVTNTYDYMGRRVRRMTEAYDGSAWAAAEDTRYLYDGWNVIVEYDGATGNIDKRFTWGLDLSNSLQGAGGVGGLLACHDHRATTAIGDDEEYLYCYDGNGNVRALLDSKDGDLLGLYDYDPYGNSLSKSGDEAEENLYRFSTKPWDDVAGLYYYGYRHYSPAMGRWVSQDPIGERGGTNQYEFAYDSPVNMIDVFGLVPYSLNLADSAACGTFVLCPNRKINWVAQDSTTSQYNGADYGYRVYFVDRATIDASANNGKGAYTVGGTAIAHQPCCQGCSTNPSGHKNKIRLVQVISRTGYAPRIDNPYPKNRGKNRRGGKNGASPPGMSDADRPGDRLGRAGIYGPNGEIGFEDAPFHGESLDATVSICAICETEVPSAGRNSNYDRILGCIRFTFRNGKVTGNQVDISGRGPDPDSFVVGAIKRSQGTQPTSVKRITGGGPDENGCFAIQAGHPTPDFEAAIEDWKIRTPDGKFPK